MEPNRREFIKQCAFQKFCNTVLHNEACDAHKELHRHKAKEITFSDLTLEEARQLHTFDEYFKGEIAFERAGKKITPKLLLEAIRTLPEEKRKAVLLYYFEGMNDTEIAELFDMILSRLVDTFFSRISLTMQLSPKPHNTAYVLPWEEGLHWQSRSSGCSSN